MRSHGETRRDQQKPENSNKNEDDEELRSELLQDVPEWPQDFKDNLVDKDVQPHQYSSSSSYELPMEKRAKVVPGSAKHSIFSHFPKDRNCDICLRTKITRASCRRRTGTVVPRAEHFGDLLTADHKVLSDCCESRHNHRYAVVVSDGKTLSERRFRVPFNGPVIPCGAIVEYHPISAKDQSRLHQFGPKVLPGIFLGCALHAGGIWKGDVMVDAFELHARRLNAKEVLTPMKGEKFIFPVADGTDKISGEGRRLRTSTLIRDRPERGEEQENLRGESDKSSPTLLQDDSTRDDAEAKNDFWSITRDFICRHHVETRVKPYVPREASFPIPLKYIDVTRVTKTSLDVMLEKILTIIGPLMEIENCQMHDS